MSATHCCLEKLESIAGAFDTRHVMNLRSHGMGRHKCVFSLPDGPIGARGKSAASAPSQLDSGQDAVTAKSKFLPFAKPCLPGSTPEYWLPRSVSCFLDRDMDKKLEDRLSIKMSRSCDEQEEHEVGLEHALGSNQFWDYISALHILTKI